MNNLTNEEIKNIAKFAEIVEEAKRYEKEVEEFGLHNFSIKQIIILSITAFITFFFGVIFIVKIFETIL